MVNVPKWDDANDKLQKGAVTFWKENFIDLKPEQLAIAMHFAWFANECRTWSLQGRQWHRNFDGGSSDNFYAKTCDAEEANRDADLTAKIIRDKSLDEDGDRTDFTFAIENPSGYLKDYPAILGLINDSKIRACVVKINQCRFGSWRSYQKRSSMMGYFHKATDIITNNPGIIEAFGLQADAPGRQWWPLAPSPRFTCSSSSGVCNMSPNHPQAVKSCAPGREMMGDVEAKELAAYPEAFSTAVALAVDNWWRREVGRYHMA